MAIFIEEVVCADFDHEVWEKVMVNHYRDVEMERARRECVRLLAVGSNGDRTKLTGDEIERLKALAANLKRP